MAEDFFNLDILIKKAAEGYSADIIDSPLDQRASITFALPFSEVELTDWLTTFRNPRHGPEEMAKAKTFGGPLFDALFTDRDMNHILRVSLDHAQTKGWGLRIRLQMNDVPELAELPWEYMYDASRDMFYVLLPDTPVIRYIGLPERTTPLAVQYPLRVLVVIAAPTDQVQLDTAHELEKIGETFGKLAEEGLVSITALPDGRLETFNAAIADEDYHIIHFIGHGEFDPATQDGVLLFETASKNTRRVSASEFSQLIAGEDSVRLIVLNACEGAYGDAKTVFAGTAQSLVRKGVPGLVAMQFKISDKAAIEFSGSLYRHIARGSAVDVALSEARRAIFSMGNNIEWGNPILFLRSDETCLFETPNKKETAEMADEKKSGGIKISVGGNIGGNVNAAEGDMHIGDRITTGDIKADGGNVVIGSNNTVSNTTNIDKSSVVTVYFEQARTQLSGLDLSDKKLDKAQEAISELEDMAEEDNPDPDMIELSIEVLEKFAPSVAEFLFNALMNPGAAVGQGVKEVIKVFKKVRSS